MNDNKRTGHGHEGKKPKCEGRAETSFLRKAKITVGVSRTSHAPEWTASIPPAFLALPSEVKELLLTAEKDSKADRSQVYDFPVIV